MTLKEWFNYVQQDFRAWMRGEMRVAPWGSRGRIYVPDPKAGRFLSFRKPGGGRGHNVRVTPSARLHMKITRKDGSVEHIDVPAKATFLGE